jgi:hypothetical protein
LCFSDLEELLYTNVEGTTTATGFRGMVFILRFDETEPFMLVGTGSELITFHEAFPSNGHAYLLVCY